MPTSNSSDAARSPEPPPEAGFTGLEAAIVLIAFVVIAAVFSYTVLQMGFASVQQSQSVIHQGIQTGSSCEVAGILYGISKTPEYIDSILIPIALTPGSQPIDMTTISIRFISARHTELVEQNNPLVDAHPGYGFWSIQKRGDANPDTLLEAGEQYILNVTPASRINCRSCRSFVIEIKPAGRAALRVERIVPGSVDRITSLN